MATLMTDIRDKEDREPAKLIYLPSLAASSAARRYNLRKFKAKKRLVSELCPQAAKLIHLPSLAASSAARI